MIKLWENTRLSCLKNVSRENKNEKFLRTKVRNLKKPLEKSGIKYEQIYKSIQHLSSSKAILDVHFNKIFKSLIKVFLSVIFLHTLV